MLICPSVEVLVEGISAARRGPAPSSRCARSRSRINGETFSVWFGRARSAGPTPDPEQFHAEFAGRAAKLAAQKMETTGGFEESVAAVSAARITEQFDSLISSWKE